MKHPPVTQGLELATDAAVTDAWEAFFSACWEWYEELERRRALKREPTDSPPSLPATSPSNKPT